MTGGFLLVNPGPVAPKRGRSSFAVLKLDAGEAEAEVIDL
jgi:hypothetical protein